MAVECPAEGCDFEGMVDAVAGHIGGSNDDVHAGVVPDRVSEAGSGGPGLSTLQVALVVAAVVLVGLAVASVAFSGEPAPEPQDDEPEEVWMDGA